MPFRSWFRRFKPFPRSETLEVVLLSECLPATRATIARIGLQTPAALQHLATLGLLPSVEVEVEKRGPFDGPVLVRVGRAHYALGRDLAARIWVERTAKEPEVSG